MSVAIIDLGTNTFHLLIGSVTETGVKVLFKTNRPVQLGESLLKENKLIPAAFERGLQCLKEFRAIIDQHEVATIKAVATSAVRSASNGAEFRARVVYETGIEIEIIDGEQEAGYIYEGVKASGAIQGPSLIMDIGGGSTEFILCDQKKIHWKKSYDIGASRLLQKYVYSDPLDETDHAFILEHLEDVLMELKKVCQSFPQLSLIGSAGAFETFAAMSHLPLNEAPSTSLSLKAYHQLADRLLKSTHHERTQMKGLIPLRVDMILMAVVQVNYVLNQCPVKELILSTYDMKMGILSLYQ